MNFRPHKVDKPELNLIPMIDVLIVLLIFLVLTTTFSHQSALKISLPQGGAPAEAQPKGIEVVIDATGHYVIDNHQTLNDEVETLKKALAAAAGANREPLITISADRKTPHQALIAVLDAASQLGFVHITFAAEATADAPKPAEP